ncbi:uncharacterized protein LOC131887219 [Tigriopus californicus]|uniref:uncharacterized protein LOC131887219 n=1 Tax=Tigriopus californicus TaxID=6832 RepID=UPI0027DA2F89|nr:uncharacterized protein LOC131887219 [Tigriopus californicus]
MSKAAPVASVHEREYFLFLIYCSETDELILQTGVPARVEVGPAAPTPTLDRDLEPGRELGLPSNQSRQDRSWKHVALQLIQELFDSKNGLTQTFPERIRFIRLLRLWYPITNTDNCFLQRMMLYLSIDQRERAQLQLSPNYLWVTSKQVLDQEMLDPGILEFLRKFLKDREQAISFCISEFTQDMFLVDVSDSRQEMKKTQEMLLQAADLSLNDQKQVYRDFFSEAFPKLFVTFPQFRRIMLKYGWPPDHLKNIFRSFNLRKHPGRMDAKYLSYSELICGLAACEPHVPHGDQTGESRTRYIFRFYCRDPSGKLDFSEFREMVRDIRRCKGFSTDEIDVLNEATVSAKVFNCEEHASLTLTDFLTGVGQLKFRGTSHLLRAPVSLPIRLRENEKMRQTSSVPSTNKGSSTISPPLSPDIGTGARKRTRPTSEAVENNSDIGDSSHIMSFEAMADAAEDDMSFISPSFEDNVGPDSYDYATHVVRVKRTGQVLDVQSLWEFEANGAVSASSAFSNAQKSNFGRLQSIRAFNVSSEANEMLKGLRYFERTVKNDPDKMPMSWGKVEMDVFARSLIDLCHLARGLIIQEPRLVKLKSPTYILGDLHGNFHDLICFEKVLWRMGPKLVPANFLFLGDYVDRGQFGVEVVAYLLAQKIAAPAKFHLLRGNHECRQIQKNFTFHRECIAKFGRDVGEKVWESINQVFDVMPIAAVIDGKIFCVHGGIPPPWMGGGLIASLDKVNKTIKSPEDEEPLVWEYLWNDPYRNEDNEPLPSEIKKQLGMNELDGFVGNYRRGTGHMFTDKALNEFLARNRLSHVIRAHEVKETGFSVQHRQRLITVFSSSKYCNGSNEAACVLADNNRIRLIRLDTAG